MGNAVTATNPWFYLNNCCRLKSIYAVQCVIYSLLGGSQMGTHRIEIYLQSLCVCQAGSRTWIKGDRKDAGQR